MPDNPSAAEPVQWVVWNPAFGLISLASIGQVVQKPEGRRAWMDRPFEMLGPFDLDALEATGRIAFEACLVMSRERWQSDQAELRQEAYAQRRAAQARLHEQQARANGRRRRHRTQQGAGLDEHQLRQTLNLPADGRLEAAQIKAAFRRLAQKAHPDVGGSHEQFVRITEARNALLDGLGG